MKNVIFDIGRVLINWDIKPMFMSILNDDQKLDQFLSDINFHEFNLQFDAGRKFTDGVKEYCEKFPHYKNLIEAFDERWIETIPNTIDGSIEILEELKEKEIPLYAITNFSHEKWFDAAELYPFLQQSFIDIVISGEVGITKPDPQIYHMLLKRNQLKPKDCIFIDDSPPNVEGAKSIGIDAILFETPQKFRKDLMLRNIL